jgi:hypothetical protein
MYVAISDNELDDGGDIGRLWGIYQTTNGGTDCTFLPNVPDFCNDQCWYDLAIAVAPNNSDDIVAGGSSAGADWVSLDGGNTWNQQDNGVHVDTHAYAFPPPTLPPSTPAMTAAPGGGTSDGVTFTIDNPVPVLSSLMPSSTEHGGSAFTLTIHGTGFVSGSQTTWNGSDRTTTYVSAGEVQKAITAADIANAGTAQVEVVNGTPGGGTSSALTFTIN